LFPHAQSSKLFSTNECNHYNLNHGTQMAVEWVGPLAVAGIKSRKDIWDLLQEIRDAVFGKATNLAITGMEGMRASARQSFKTCLPATR
jgi:hypothetical protein